MSNPKIHFAPGTEQHGGHAFPTFYADPSVGSGYAGMTLRDYFAAAALAAIIAAEYDKPYSDAARHAYTYADAMLDERQSPNL